jgi:catalase
LVHLFGSRGIPDSIRRVTGFGVHTFKMVATDGRFRYCKFHFRPTQNIAHFSEQEATRMAGANADFHTQDLWDAISGGQFPTWKLYVQVMEPEQAETYGRALFDITKVWPHKDFPLVEVGQMTLNKNVGLHLMGSKEEHMLTRNSARELLRRDRTSGFLAFQHGPWDCHDT